MALSSLSTSSNLAASRFLKNEISGLISSLSTTRVGHKCTSTSCRICSNRSLVVRASMESSNEAVKVEAEAAFASLSETVATPPSAAPYNGPGAPLIIGSGLLAAAGLVFAANKLVPSKEKKGPEVLEKVLGPASTLPPPGTPFPYPARSVKKAAAPALQSMATYFPNAIVDTAFVHACATELFNLGFTKTNCIALVNTCRDEVCRPLASLIDEEFGLSFNLSGLGGLINSGKTGFKAGMSHSPEFPCDVSGKPRERYVFFAFPHVSVGETGEVGSLLRRGRGKPSSACGALIAIQNDAKSGKPVVEDVDDAEYVLLKKKVLASHLCKNCGPAGPDLVTVTKAALQVITSDLEKIVSQVVNPATADYAVITGIQIHSGDQIPGQEFKIDRTIDYIAPGTMYAVIQGKKYDMTVSAPTPAAVSA